MYLGLDGEDGGGEGEGQKRLRERERERKAGMGGGKQEDERGTKPTNQLKENERSGLFERGREKRREEGERERVRLIVRTEEIEVLLLHGHWNGVCPLRICIGSQRSPACRTRSKM